MKNNEKNELLNLNMIEQYKNFNMQQNKKRKTPKFDKVEKNSKI